MDVSNNTALTSLSCGSAPGATFQLTTLDVSNNPALKVLNCQSNQLTTLDLSNNTALESLYCAGNQLKTLDVSNHTALTYLSCGHNQLTTLDVSKTNLGNSIDYNPLSCYMNTLKTLYLKTGWEINGITPNRNTLYISEQTTIEFVD